MELNQTSICYYDKRLAGISSCTESSDSIVPDTFPEGSFARMERQRSRTAHRRTDVC